MGGMKYFLSALSNLRFVLFFLPVVSLLAPPAAAWCGGGHQVIASMAAERLSPATRAEAERLLGELAHLEPRSETIPRASIWLDELRQGGLRVFDDWHWVNLPVEPEGGGLAPAEPPGDLLRVTRQAVRVLGDHEADGFSRAFMLRVLLHTVPDAHQPLHCVTRYTADEPGGDRGGNRFEIDDPDNEWENLHFLWDHGLGILPQVRGAIGADETAAAVARIGGGELPPDLARRAENLEPLAWCEEGREIAETVVYQGIEEGGRPSPEYVRRGQEVVRRQILLSVERLVRILERTLGPATAPDSAAAATD